MGIDGAASFLTERGRSIPRLDVFDIPTMQRKGKRQIDMRAWHRLLHEWSPDLAYIEWSWAIPLGGLGRGGKEMKGQGIASAGRTQRIHGQIESQVWTATEADPVYVTSQVWKEFFGLEGGQVNKATARDLIVELFPEAMRFFLRAKDHNRAESSLITVYGAHRAGMIKIKGQDGQAK